jgi:hypothetical protein
LPVTGAAVGRYDFIIEGDKDAFEGVEEAYSANAFVEENVGCSVGLEVGWIELLGLAVGPLER